jgi:hypothetical protein
MRELFIYYRVRPGTESTALNIVQTMQRNLRQAFPHVQARLLRRPESAGTMQTWMEIYAMKAESCRGSGIDAALEQAIDAEATALAPCIDGGRHVEVFVPVPNEPEVREG